MASKSQIHVQAASPLGLSSLIFPIQALQRQGAISTVHMAVAYLHLPEERPDAKGGAFSGIGMVLEGSSIAKVFVSDSQTHIAGISNFYSSKHATRNQRCQLIDSKNQASVEQVRVLDLWLPHLS